MVERRRRVITAVLGLVLVFFGVLTTAVNEQRTKEREAAPLVLSENTGSAYEALAKLEIKGRAPKTGYEREQFGAGWADVDACDMRNYILQRDMEKVQLSPNDNCTVLGGTLNDPYTGKTIQFRRGTGSSSAVQIDHVVALSDAWQKGAQQLDEGRRAEFASK
jgi:hypothetical protein